MNVAKSLKEILESCLLKDPMRVVKWIFGMVLLVSIFLLAASKCEWGILEFLKLDSFVNSYLWLISLLLIVSLSFFLIYLGQWSLKVSAQRKAIKSLSENEKSLLLEMFKSDGACKWLNIQNIMVTNLAHEGFIVCMSDIPPNDLRYVLWRQFKLQKFVCEYLKKHLDFK